MIVKIYSKEGCGKCEAAKEKMKRMGIDYEEHTLEFHTSACPGWRDRGDDRMAAELAMTGKEISHCLPTIEINGKFFDYAGAMAKLKKK